MASCGLCWKGLREQFVAKSDGAEYVTWNMHTSKLNVPLVSTFYVNSRDPVAPSELVQFYVTCIRPVLEYASPVFHRSLPNYISEDLERIQRRAFRIIYPDLSYSVALETVGLPKLHERREKISIDLFDEIVCNPTHRPAMVFIIKHLSIYLSRPLFQPGLRLFLFVGRVGGVREDGAVGHGPRLSRRGCTALPTPVGLRFEGVLFGQQRRPALHHLSRALALYVFLLGQSGGNPAPAPRSADPLKKSPPLVMRTLCFYF